MILRSTIATLFPQTAIYRDYLDVNSGLLVCILHVRCTVHAVFTRLAH